MYYEWRCEDCEVIFECGSDDPNYKFFCVECRGENLTLLSYDINMPTQLQLLAKEIEHLTGRLRRLEEALGVEEDEDLECRDEH